MNNSNKMRRLVFILVFIFAQKIALAQEFYKKNYPKGYFIWPVGTAVGLNANFGELRPDHYHMGLDAKTDKKENLQILAAADGYIAKVKIERWGFGRAIYINHPNGFTTLYAHLNAFMPALEAYINAEQYKAKSWSIYLENIPDSLFKVTKGQYIASSGNTGGSLGPHLHFEIRNTVNDKVLNPILFGFPIIDNVPPDVLKLVMYDRCKSVYEQTPVNIPIKKTSLGYEAVMPLINTTEKVSFAITSYDKFTGSTNQNGIYQGILYDNEVPIVGFELDSIDYNETRYLNAHIDYKMKLGGGGYVQHLSRLPGHTKTSVYKEFSGTGLIDLSDDIVHPIKIKVVDASGNFVYIKLNIKNALTLFNRSSGVNSKKIFMPGIQNNFRDSDFFLLANDSCLYDSVRIDYRKINTKLKNSASLTYNLIPGLIPAHSKINVGIKNDSIAENLKQYIIFACTYSSKSPEFVKPIIDEKGFYTAALKHFGSMRLILDSVPPMLVPIGFKDGANISKLKQLIFAATDDYSDDEYVFSATLDGEWIRFTNDKGKNFIYTIDEKFPSGMHLLKVSIKDIAGNERILNYNLTK